MSKQQIPEGPSLEEVKSDHLKTDHDKIMEAYKRVIQKVDLLIERQRSKHKAS